MSVCLADDFLVSDAIEVGAGGSRAKRVHRTAEEKRRIVEATLVPGASIARVARENGVNANQVFQWRYEQRKGVGWAAERALRVVALGRKNFLFCGSDAGGERAAAIYSLLGTAKLNGLDPELYLRRVLEQIADHPISRIQDLLP
jgi:hypothetical protein